MPKYSLHYFDARGRAEYSRLVAVAAGIEFTDARFQGAEWPAKKATTPLGQVPYLEVDSVALPQSVAIARFFAREGNLAGRTNLEQAQADAIVDTAVDALNSYMQKVFSQPDEKKEEAGKTFLAESIPVHFGNLEKLFSLYGKNGYAVGDSLTWADLFVYEFVSSVEARYKTSVTEKYPHLDGNKKIVEGHPKAGPYVKSRPASAF